MNRIKISSTIRNIQKNVASIAYDGKAVIAGGYIRDLTLGRQFKDVDIFLYTKSGKDVISNSLTHSFWNTILPPSNIISPRVKDTTYHSACGDYSVQDYSPILDTWIIRRHNVCFNIIIISIPVEEYINEWFDIGLCKCYLDSEKVRYTNDFIHDSRNNYLTLVSKHFSQNSFIYSHNAHATRIQEKYPGYRVVVPDYNQHLMPIKLRTPSPC